MWGFCSGSWRLWRRFRSSKETQALLVSLCMPNGKAWAATYRNHLGGSSSLGWLVKKKESYKRSSCPHSVLFGCGIHLIAVEMLIWLGTLCKTQISNIKQIVYTWKPSKLSWLEDTLFQPTYTPRRQMGPSTYMFFKKNMSQQTNSNTTNRYFFLHVSRHTKRKQPKKIPPRLFNLTKLYSHFLEVTIRPLSSGHVFAESHGSHTYTVYPIVFHDPVIPVAFGECSSVYLHVP